MVACIECDNKISSIVDCSICKGSGRLRWHIELTVRFDIHISETLNKPKAISTQKLKRCESTSTFYEKFPRV